MSLDDELGTTQPPYQWPCPICGALTVQDYRDIGEGVILEEANHCPNGCMDYRFAYGGSEERIGNLTWVWSYDETPEEAQVRHTARTQQIEKMKAEREILAR